MELMTRRPGPAHNLVADGAPLDQHLADCLKTRQSVRGIGLLAATYPVSGRAWTIVFAILTILGPLDIHRAAVVLFDDEGLFARAITSSSVMQSGFARRSTVVSTTLPMAMTGIPE